MKKILASLLTLATLFVATPTYAAICELSAPFAVGDEIFGRDDANPNHIYIASKFVASQDCTVTGVGGKAFGDSSGKKAQFLFFTDSAGTPDTIIETGSLWAAGTAPTYVYGTSTFSSTNLVSGTTYWVAIGSDTNNSNAGYTQFTAIAGVNKVWNLSDWSSVTSNDPNKQMFYVIEGTTGGAAAAVIPPTYQEIMVW